MLPMDLKNFYQHLRHFSCNNDKTGSFTGFGKTCQTGAQVNGYSYLFFCHCRYTTT